MSKKSSPIVDQARVQRPHRSQVEMQFFALDELLPSDHQARIVWAYVKSLDLERFYAKIQVSATQAGRPAIAPEILLTLWLFATIEGVASAREIERRAERDIAYRWICGNVTVNYHTISDFRSNHAEELEALLVDSLAALVNQQLIPLETIAQDGMRVRACAGRSSFRRKPTLEALQSQAKVHLEELNKRRESEEERRESDKRREAAQLRAAQEREARIAEALRQQEELSKQREKRVKGLGAETRVSTTDPDARNMKMANGGYSPAMNVQFATDGDTRIIVGVIVTNEGNDASSLVPMRDKLIGNYGKKPEHILVDSAYAMKEGVTIVERNGSKVVAGFPRVEQLLKNGKNPHTKQKGDTSEYAEFRRRMAESKYKEMYKRRPSIAEFPNAVCRNRGLQRFLVRGLQKTKAVALIHALAFNLTRLLNQGMCSLAR
ncbi:MAG: IS1182 family transposase [Pirellulales bacterium]